MANLEVAICSGAILAAAAVAAAARGDGCDNGAWARFFNETASRLVAPADVGTADVQERDYAWGDVDQDGDIDLLVVRKEPWEAGRRRNVFFRNEGKAEGHALDGVLVDRTFQYMSMATDGAFGFLDQTASRDVVLVDVNLDGWLDVVTATAFGQGLPKTISHSRVYINLGLDVDRIWQGFLYDEPRIPQLSAAPNASAVAAGDVTGDGYPDLYYVTFQQSPLEDHLLINDGKGFFTDQSSDLPAGMINSNYATSAAIADMNGDGWADVAKNNPGNVQIFYNLGGLEFLADVATAGAHYSVSLGELNNDGLLDLVVGDDGTDRYCLNEGPAGGIASEFDCHTFTYVGGGSDDGFAGNSVTADLDDDGANDVLIADTDADAAGCSRRTHIYRNLGTLPVPTLQEELIDGAVVNIPTSQLTGTFDVAVFDIDGDGRLDIVLGRCTGMSIWMNRPLFAYTADLPAGVHVDQPAPITVQINPAAGKDVLPGSALIHVSIDDGPFAEEPMLDLGGGVFHTILPTSQCGTLSYYFTVELHGFGTCSDPRTAPNDSYQTIVTAATDVDGNGLTDVADLVALIVAWGSDDPAADIDGDGVVGVADLVALLLGWGPC